MICATSFSSPSCSPSPRRSRPVTGTMTTITTMTDVMTIATTFVEATRAAQMMLTTNQNGRLVMIADTKAETEIEDTKTMTMIDWIVLCERSILIGLITGALWALL